ncbi:MAG: sigma-54 dependent transcriptional regulator [Deltaproteobacteria bacterium]|nr:sigma-54 dependent transcriptional regulator [Deltaproteobacteria bacterium]
MLHPTLLIIKSDEKRFQQLKKLLESKPYRLIEASRDSDIATYFDREKPDLVIVCSCDGTKGDGLQAAAAIRRQDRNVPMILVTQFSSEAFAIAALRAGINDYFKVPFSGKSLLDSIARHLPSSKVTNGNGARTEASTTCPYYHQPLLGDSQSMQDLLTYLHKIALTDSTVLVTGETGTGKELVAELIHCSSPRAMQPFVCVNCAALPENLVESELFGFDRGAFTGAIAGKKGKFELADGGTVLLDEIGDMNLHAQAKILRTIEQKEVYPLGGKKAVPLDVRVIAATHQEPEELMSGGNFRQDLYYRLNIARIHMPPLRERKEDIPVLADFAINKLNQRYHRNIQGLTDEVLANLMRYDWPGNIRELMNLLEATYVNPHGKKIRMAHLPPAFRKKLKETRSSSGNERNYIVSTLISTNWHKANTAHKLSWSRMTLYRKIIKYNIVQHRNPPR